MRKEEKRSRSELSTVDESLTDLLRQLPTKKFRLHFLDFFFFFSLSGADKTDDITHTDAHKQTRKQKKNAAWIQGSAKQCSLSETQLVKAFLLSKKKKKKQQNFSKGTKALHWNSCPS